MIEKNDGNSPKSDDSFKLLQENEIETSNFKLLYRKTPNPERDRSSGVSSDEETTSSSLVPIPDSLKQLRSNSKWTMSDSGDHSVSLGLSFRERILDLLARDLAEGKEAHMMDTPYVCGFLGDSTGNIMNSLEELRKKYTLKNETSVALKMNSANQMLDDILNSANWKNLSSNNPSYKCYKKEEYTSKTSPESETSTTESSVSQIHPCPYFADLAHLPIALDFYPSPCPRHSTTTEVVHSSISTKDKEPIIYRRNLEINQRKKSLVEKFQDLQLGCRIQSVYKNLQKTRNPFTKSKKDPESANVPQGIPGAGCEGDTGTDTEQAACKCGRVCSLNHCSKKMVLDLVEPSEVSQSDFRSTDREDHCVYLNQRRCTCPEVVPKCACGDLVYPISENTSSSLSTRPTSECPTKVEEQVQTTRPVTPTPRKNENESNLLLEKEIEDNKRSKQSLTSNTKGWKKHCSKERNLIERTDIYYFDHGNSAYYQTTDNHPMRYTECLVERTDEYATKFWAEFFGTIEIGIAFLISFILQLYRFLFTSVIRSLTVGLLQIFSDYFFKPLLTIIFNGIIQPCLILVYNITTSFRDLCLPISQIFGFFAREVANVLKSCRLVEVTQGKEYSCHCGNKV